MILMETLGHNLWNIKSCKIFSICKVVDLLSIKLDSKVHQVCDNIGKSYEGQIGLSHR